MTSTRAFVSSELSTVGDMAVLDPAGVDGESPLGTDIEDEPRRPLIVPAGVDTSLTFPASIRDISGRGPVAISQLYYGATEVVLLYFLLGF